MRPARADNPERQIFVGAKQTACETDELKGKAKILNC
jgi:hypothetical protein